MLPYWLFGLITLAACGIGGGIICGLFALGIKHGFDDAFKNSDSDVKAKTTNIGKGIQ